MAEIIFEDRDTLVCIKPSGVLSEGEGDNCMPTLLARLCGSPIFPVHRLDRETAGLMVFAKNQASAASLSEHIRKGNMKKQYLAVVHGVPEKSEDTLDDLLFFDRARGKSFIVDRPRKGVKQALLDYRVLDSRDSLSLLAVDLHTGRTHQIRAQLSHRRHPIVGDRRYGAPKNEAGTFGLLSYSLSFPHPTTGEPLNFRIQMPNGYPWDIFELPKQE